MTFRLWNGTEAAESSPEELRSFVEAITGKSVPGFPQSSSGLAAEAELCQFVRDISTPHEQWNLNRNRDVRSGSGSIGGVGAGSHEAELNAFVAAIRGEPARLLPGSVEAEAHERELCDFVRDITTCHERYNPSEPRDAIGQWTSDGGGGGGPKSAGGPAPKPADGSRYYLPSDTKGTWEGEAGNSKFRLEKPIIANGKRVTHIEFKNGLPDLDKFALPGKTATVILTDHKGIDQVNARRAWQELNPGKQLPAKTVFHHDLRRTAEQIVTINGKKTKVLVGELPLLPTEAHKLFHQGSASVARDMYKGLEPDASAIRDLARKEASLAGKKGTIVARAAKKIKTGVIPKSIRHLIGRNIARVIPLVTTGLAIIEFSDNVEAHGVGGAVARAVPVLGDLISAHDLGSELAKQIRDDASSASDEHQRSLNAAANEAWDKASQQTIEAFNELAPQISVTNPYSPNGRVDPNEVAEALKTYRDAMQAANSLKAHNAKGFDFPVAAARAKQELKERLTKACQQRAPQASGPTL